jgi:hypothetical protein
MLKTTVDSANRKRDKERIESTLGLPEFGNEIQKFFTLHGIHIATGYRRIVYGDHGPYIEFERHHVLFDKFILKRKFWFAWYDEWRALDGTMLYDQKRTVENLPNPPKGKYSVKNARSEGYADYVVGMLYVDPEKIKLT